MWTTRLLTNTSLRMELSLWSSPKTVVARRFNWLALELSFILNSPGAKWQPTIWLSLASKSIRTILFKLARMQLHNYSSSKKYSIHWSARAVKQSSAEKLLRCERRHLRTLNKFPRYGNVTMNVMITLLTQIPSKWFLTRIRFWLDQIC